MLLQFSMNCDSHLTALLTLGLFAVLRAYMRPIVTDGVPWSVCLSVCRSVCHDRKPCTKRTNRSKYSFGCGLGLVHGSMHQIGCPQRRNLANTTEPSVCGGDVAFIKLKSKFPKLAQFILCPSHYFVIFSKTHSVLQGWNHKKWRWSMFWKFALQLLCSLVVILLLLSFLVFHFCFCAVDCRQDFNPFKQIDAGGRVSDRCC